MSCEQRLEEREGVSHENVWGKSRARTIAVAEGGGMLGV